MSVSTSYRSVLEYLVQTLLTTVLLCNKSSEAVQTPVNNEVQYKVLIPNLYQSHYQFWLKTHPQAYSEYEKICGKLANGSEVVRDIRALRDLHENFSFEDPNYLENFEYGFNILQQVCSKIKDIPQSCWGYERNCQIIHLMPECHGSSLGGANDEGEHKIKWFTQADFGYILERRKEMKRFCIPDKHSSDANKSSLECTSYFRTCRGENLYLTFKEISLRHDLLDQPIRDIIHTIGGSNCDLQLKRIPEEAGHSGNLESWYKELQGYELIQEPDQACDIVVDKQVYFVKLDHASNMYHYFCNFLNLYATMHLNNKFSDDNEIIIWDGIKPRSSFEVMWSVFSRNPYKTIQSYSGKRVCFRKFIFSFLPRMVEGLYYNTPLIPGCSKSGLFEAFNKHVIHRLGIEQKYIQQIHEANHEQPLRITLITRSTSHRRILNEDELIKAIRNSSDHVFRHVDFARMINFKDQLTVTYNTDILIGLHGAGLTHLLFLPSWASVIELSDCQDKCYSDLSRLRGVGYFTESETQKLAERVKIEDREESERLTKQKLIDHPKFSNYRIVINETLELLKRVVVETKRDRKKQFAPLRKLPKTIRFRFRNSPSIKPQSDEEMGLPTRHDEL